MSKKITLSALILLPLALLGIYRTLAAPPGPGGVGSGAISTDANGNVTVSGALTVASTTNVSARGIHFSDGTTQTTAPTGSGATTTPAALISAVGAFGSSTGGGNYTFSAGLTADSPTFFVDAVNHRVGIGTTTPATALTLDSGRITVPCGVASVPGYSFLDHPTTGMFSDCSTLGFSVNGSRKGIIDSGGFGGAGFNFDGVWTASASGYPASTGIGFQALGTINWNGSAVNAGITGDVGIARLTTTTLKITDGSTGYGTLIAGNVGIGLTGPNQKLEVAGNTSSTQFCLGGSCISSWAGAGGSYIADPWRTSGTYVILATSTNFVGIGKNPGTALDVNGTITATTFSGAGTSLTGTAASLTAGAVPWSGVSGQPAFAANAVSGRVRIYEAGCGSSYATSCDVGTNGYIDYADTAGTAGTVTTAAQPNITSVGTLTSLGVSGAVTAGSFSGAGTGLTGTAASLTAGIATNATYHSEATLAGGSAGAVLPTTSGYKVRYDFTSAASAGTGGNYAGVMTYAPYDGTTGSTGDASYQFAYGSTAINGGGLPILNIRKGIDSTWNSWYTILHSGNVGTYALPITGGTLTGDITTYRSGSPTTGVMFFGNSGTKYLYYDGTNFSMMGGALVVGSGGTGKITVGTVDPPYTIGGAQYATYLPGMVGQKEETTGELSLPCAQGVCKSTIDFNSVEKGSDLWLFSRASDLRKNMDAMTVLLTPSFDGRVWYEKDATNLKLTIFASVPTTYYSLPTASVSYRLTAPRFDSANFPNTRSDGAKGLEAPNW